MKKILQFIIALFLTLPLCFADCTFSGDIQGDFKNCFPETGIKTQANVNLNVQESGSDFRTMMSTLIRRAQIVTSVIAIGVIVWIGLIMVLPVSAEAKESAKSKVLSVVFGFLFMISATIVVNAIINILYDVFK